MKKLVFYDPGHFHAALLLGAANPRVSPDIHVYAPAGDDLDRFVALVRTLNQKITAADRWQLSVHRGEDGLQQVISRHRGAIVVLAGKNAPRLAIMQQLYDAGFPILADKPWLTDSRDLPLLDRVTSGLPLTMDIMTSRFDTGARLRQKIITDKDIFGGFENRSDGTPALEMSFLHHLCKLAAGEPLRRPTWHYDIRIQGDGMVYIQTHMTDQAQWLIANDQAMSFAEDFELVNASRWTTAVPLATFSENTGASQFPANLKDDLEDGVLQLACNGEINYRLMGFAVRQKAEWALKTADNGGDCHFLAARGRYCDLILRQDQSTGFQSDMRLRPNAAFDLLSVLQQKVAAWQADFPGLSIEPVEDGVRLLIPDTIKIGHEAHFPLLLDHYLDRLEHGHFPDALAGNIRARYTLLAHARDMALVNDG
jgi:hypothetical protein